MRYFSFPTTDVGTGPYQITVDGTNEFQNLRGGNDAGGPYVWSDMPLIPDASTTLAQRQAIGRLCHDVALADEASFTATGTGAYLSPADLKSIFLFSQAIEGWWDNRGVWNMVNASLDAGLPLSMSIRRTGGSHLVLCDGYGYNLSTPYHHLNMGWGGSDNAWYNLPDIDAVNHQYPSVIPYFPHISNQTFSHLNGTYFPLPKLVLRDIEEFDNRLLRLCQLVSELLNTLRT